jgi:hypothetical protein
MAHIQDGAICLYLVGNGFWEAKSWATNGWSATRKLCDGWRNIAITLKTPQ